MDSCPKCGYVDHVPVNANLDNFSDREVIAALVDRFRTTGFTMTDLCDALRKEGYHDLGPRVAVQYMWSKGGSGMVNKRLNELPEWLGRDPGESHDDGNILVHTIRRML